MVERERKKENEIERERDSYCSLVMIGCLLSWLFSSPLGRLESNYLLACS